MFKYISLLCVLLFSSLLTAEPNIVAAPAALQKWHAWVLSQNPDLKCSASAQLPSRNCQWHSPLSVQVIDKKISFSQRVLIESSSWVGLPGSVKAWPDKVAVNQLDIAVMRRNNRPAVFLTPGDYLLTGHISLSSVPSSLLLPSTATFVDLVVNGKEIFQPRVDNNALLLNRAQPKVAKASDSVSVQVYRLIRDGYPLQLETQIDINVAGQRRIQSIGRVLPEGFELSHVQSKLPLRVSDNGDIQIQLDAGRHRVFIKARHSGAEQYFQMQARADWPQQELWSFIPDRRYRIVDVQGSPIDATQTGMPAQWKQYSSFLVTAKKGLKLIEKSRGDSQPDQHQLFLKRNLWLNFSGDKFTTQEQLYGSIGYLDRISTEQDYQAGRVSINRQPTLITTVDDDQGVEVLPGAIDILSVGQISEPNFVINPWSSPLNEAKLTVHLPPGFKVFSVQGADSVSNDYLSSWRLWDIFIVILFVVILFKQYGIVAGVAGLAYSLIVHNIADAPHVIVLLIVLGLHFITRLLGEHSVKKYALKVYQLALLMVVVSFLPFAVEQARLSIYPQLEKDYQMRSSTVALDRAPQSSMQDDIQEMQMSAMSAMQKTPKLSADMSRNSNVAAVKQPRKYINDYQENEIVQTGPGLPNWRWNTVNINLTGPIAVGQRVDLLIITPWMSRLQNLLSILLFVLLAYLFMRKQSFFNTDKGQRLEQTTLKGGTGQQGKVTARYLISMLSFAVTLLFTASLLLVPSVSANSFPSESLLLQYYERLNAPAICQPHCVAINTLDISANDQSIELEMTVVALANVPLALPIDYRKLRSVQLTVDGQETQRLLKFKNTAYVLLERGEHTLQIKLNSTDLSLLDLQFKEVPQITRVSLDGWKVSGIDKRSIRNARIQLRKHKEQVVSPEQKRLSANVIKPLVKVTRLLNLDLQWSVTTTVTRVAPEYGAISLAIPLLKGESLTSANVKTRDRSVLLDLAAGARSVSWRSDLEKVSSIQLIAEENQYMYEVWQLMPSLRWHLEHTGIKPIKSNNMPLTWFPVALDRLQISAQKPKPVEGKSVTVEAVSLVYTPGRRQSKANLLLKLRASKGADYALRLPPQAAIESIYLNGSSIIYAAQNGTVNLPLEPGTNAFDINWLEKTPVSLVTQTPPLQIASASNIKMTIELPENRWVIGVQGPLIGPAILFWGVLLVILCLGFVLGRQRWSALKSWQWMLMGTGIATSFWPITLLVVLWFFILAKRSQMINLQSSPKKFQLVQVLIALLTLIMLISLIASVANSLTFGSPDMQVVGNGSYAHSLQWYQDISDKQLPIARVVSVPMWCYQLLMLLWSIWLASALIGWLKWGWAMYCLDGAWKASPKKAKPKVSEKPAKTKSKDKPNDPWNDQNKGD